MKTATSKKAAKLSAVADIVSPVIEAVFGKEHDFFLGILNRDNNGVEVTSTVDRDELADIILNMAKHIVDARPAESDETH